jgi:hypothetical protein
MRSVRQEAEILLFLLLLLVVRLPQIMQHVMVVLLFFVELPVVAMLRRSGNGSIAGASRSRRAVPVLPPR